MQFSTKTKKQKEMPELSHEIEEKDKLSWQIVVRDTCQMNTNHIEKVLEV